MTHDKKDLLSIETALRNREFEIQLFWQRTNYFLVLITALGIGAFTTQSPFLGFSMSIFAVITSLLWYRTNLGSRFWQVFWEDEVERMAEDHGLISFTIKTDEIKRRMKDRMAQENRPGTFGIRRFIDRAVINKPSVTYHMILLSLLSLFFWLAVAGYYGVKTFGPVSQITATQTLPSTAPPPPTPAKSSP